MIDVHDRGGFSADVLIDIRDYVVVPCAGGRAELE
jgi:hypothetical protein